MTFSGGKMDVDVVTGVVTTPVGLVTHQSIVDGRAFLDRMQTYVAQSDLDNPKFIDSLENYLMCVPQKVGSRRGWHREFLQTSADVIRQAAFLDQLDASIEIAETAKKQMVQTEHEKMPKVFDVKLARVEDRVLWKKIQDLYFNTRNDMHAARRLKPTAAYEVHISSMAESFQKDGVKVGNIQSLWHGTRTHNLLSILKVGLIIPKSGGDINITGRMFGDGLYFSDQSTKALNYAYGYWDGAGRSANCFMFLADVAMGKAYVPSGPISRSLPMSGYDSTFAKAHKSGVMNNEMIVYRTGQANLKYLIEFAE
jgi:poly [ADP-ribose] polymerase